MTNSPSQLHIKYYQFCIIQVKFMGGGQSQEEKELVFTDRSKQYIKIKDLGSYELWEDRISAKLYMAFLVNSKESSTAQNLQICYYRKLNHSYLVGVQGLLKNEECICSHLQHSIILVEYMPYRISEFRGKFTFLDSLTLLKAVFSGFRILNYIFGPLYASQAMIWMTEAGVPKVWANSSLNCNEPSFNALNLPQESWRNMTLQQKQIKCSKSIVMTIENTLSQNYPLRLRNALNRIKTFEDGSKVVEDYCKQNNIYLSQHVNISNFFTSHRTQVLSNPPTVILHNQRQLSQMPSNLQYRPAFAHHRLPSQQSISLHIANSNNNRNRISNYQRQININYGLASSLQRPTSNHIVSPSLTVNSNQVNQNQIQNEAESLQNEVNQQQLDQNQPQSEELSSQQQQELSSEQSKETNQILQIQPYSLTSSLDSKPLIQDSGFNQPPPDKVQNDIKQWEKSLVQSNHNLTTQAIQPASSKRSSFANEPNTALQLQQNQEKPEQKFNIQHKNNQRDLHGRSHFTGEYEPKYAFGTIQQEQKNSVLQKAAKYPERQRNGKNNRDINQLYNKYVINRPAKRTGKLEVPSLEINQKKDHYQSVTQTAKRRLFEEEKNNGYVKDNIINSKGNTSTSYGYMREFLKC